MANGPGTLLRGDRGSPPQPQQQRDDGGGGTTALLILGVGVLGFGAWELLKGKGCPAGQVKDAATGKCGVPAVPQVVPPGSTPSPTCPTPVNLHPALPPWWPSLSPAARLGVATFYVMLGRWPATPPAGDIAWLERTILQGGAGQTGVRAVGVEIVGTAGQEIIADINALTNLLCNGAGAIECFDPVSHLSIYPQTWVTAAYCQLMGRLPDPAGLAYFTGVFNAGNPDGRVQVLMDMVALSSGEFVNRVNAALASWGG